MPDRRIDEVWLEQRPYLLVMASRMLRGRADAEDVVQEAFGRLASANVAEIDDPRGWLMVVVRHLCLDVLSSAHARRDSTPGWLTESGTPVLGERPDDPADRVTLDDEVQLALALVLDRLSPAERTSFVLHDVFGFPFDAVGDLVGRTPGACRQLASRARTAIRTGNAPHRSTVEIDHQRVVAERFIAACAGGDLSDLMLVLDPDVVGEATLEGHGPFVLLEGRPAVAKRILELLGPDTEWTMVPVPIEHSSGVVAVDHGRVVAMFRLDTRLGVIHHLHGFVRRPAGSSTGTRR